VWPKGGSAGIIEATSCTSSDRRYDGSDSELAMMTVYIHQCERLGRQVLKRGGWRLSLGERSFSQGTPPPKVREFRGRGDIGSRSVRASGVPAGLKAAELVEKLGGTEKVNYLRLFASGGRGRECALSCTERDSHQF